MGPARMIAESLTPKPGIREQYLPLADQVHRSKERLLESSFVSSLAADRRPHYDFAAALPLGVIESQPLVWPNLASSSHPCALAYLIAGRISPSFNPVSAAT